MIILLAISGCSSKLEMMPDWFLKVSETSRLEPVGNGLYLIDDCQLSSNKYWLEKTIENKVKVDYKMGKSERFSVLDFKVIENIFLS